MSEKQDPVELARDWLARKQGIATSENGDLLADTVLKQSYKLNKDSQLFEIECLKAELGLARAEVERLRGVLGETLDRLLAFVDRDEHDSDDLAILDATIAKARRARRGGGR